jgi:hypothetical protein
VWDDLSKCSWTVGRTQHARKDDQCRCMVQHVPSGGEPPPNRLACKRQGTPCMLPHFHISKCTPCMRTPSARPMCCSTIVYVQQVLHPGTPVHRCVMRCGVCGWFAEYSEHQAHTHTHTQAHHTPMHRCTPGCLIRLSPGVPNCTLQAPLIMVDHPLY